MIFFHAMRVFEHKGEGRIVSKIQNEGEWFIRFELKLAFLAMDERTGEIERNFSTVTTVSTEDGCSQDYMKDIFLAALKNAGQIIDDMEEE